MKKRPHRDTICAVIVTFNPDDSFTTSTEKLFHQVKQIVIVDNGSDPSVAGRLKKLSSVEMIHLILNDTNVGLATALNQGVKWAKENEFDWVLLFDQDTEPTEIMVESLSSVYDDFEETEKLGIIGSNYYNLAPQTPEYSFKTNTGQSWVERKSVITSGSLISMDVISTIGLFRDDFFIDFVDDEYCFRVRRNGFKVVMSILPLMKHAIGSRRGHRLPGHTVESSNHSPQRRYYMSRNFVVMAREYLFRDPGWVLWKLYKLKKTMALITLFEKDRSKKLRYMLKGMWHGVRGKLGKLD